jgi:hypothetical protein
MESTSATGGRGGFSILLDPFASEYSPSVDRQATSQGPNDYPHD